MFIKCFLTTLKKTYAICLGGHPSYSHQGGINCGNAATTLRGVNSFSERNFFLETQCTSKDWDEDQVEERMNNFSWLFQAPLCLAVFLELCKCFCPARENTSLKRLPGKWCKYKKMSKLAQFFFSILRLYFQNEKCRRRKGVECENISMKKSDS